MLSYYRDRCAEDDDVDGSYDIPCMMIENPLFRKIQAPCDADTQFMTGTHPNETLRYKVILHERQVCNIALGYDRYSL